MALLFEWYRTLRKENLGSDFGVCGSRYWEDCGVVVVGCSGLGGFMDW